MMFRVSVALFFGLLCQRGSAAGPIRVLLNENRLEEALQACRQYEVLAGYDSDILLSCTWVYYRLDKAESAEKLLSRLNNPASLPETPIISAYGKIRSAQYDAALTLLETAEKQNSGNKLAIVAQEVKAELFEARGQLDTAAFIYKQVVTNDSRRGRAHWGLGRYYLAKGDTRRATVHLTEVTQLWPRHLGSRFNLGVIYLGQDDLSQAARWLSQCYNLNRADVGVLEQLGNLFEKKGNIKEALKHWQKAIDLGSDSSGAREKLAKYLFQNIEDLLEQKKYSEALVKLDTLPADVRSQARILLWRGTIYRNLGNYKRASGELLAYLQKDPDNARALRELGICYLNLELTTQALRSFEKAVAQDPMDGYAQAWLAYLLESKGDLEKAREHWNLAISQLKESQELEKAIRRVTAIEKKLRERKK